MVFQKHFLSVKLKTFGISTRYQYLKKLSVRKVPHFPFPCFCFLWQIPIIVSILFRLICRIAVVSYVLI